MNLALLLLAQTMRKLREANYDIKTPASLYKALDKVTNGRYFTPKRNIFHDSIVKGRFELTLIDTLVQNNLKDGLAAYCLYGNLVNEEGAFIEFEKKVTNKDADLMIDEKSIYLSISSLYKGLSYDDFLEKLNQKKNDKNIELSPQKDILVPKTLKKSLVGTYYSYISYQGLPDKAPEKGIDPRTKVVKAVWRMYMDNEEKLCVERKGLANTLRKGYLELFEEMIYIHLFDTITGKYTVYTSRLKDGNQKEIRCNRIYAPEGKPYIFKEILFNQTIKFEKEETKLINWNHSDITDDIRRFISFPITPYHNDIKIKNISSLKGIWKIYFWQKYDNNEYKHRIRVCTMIITGQFNIRYSVPHHIYWNGYIQKIEGTQKFSMIFKEKERHSVFNFELENINNFETISLITLGYTVSGSNRINSGVAVLEKQDLKGRNVNDLNIEDKEFDYKDTDLEDFIKDKNNHKILKNIPQPEFSIPVSQHKLNNEDEWYFGNWLLFTLKDNNKETIHVGKLQIISNSVVYFNSSRTGKSIGFITASGSKEVLEIELMGEKRRGFFIAKINTKNIDNELEVGFVSIDIKQEEPSLGIGYLVRESYFNENYDISEPLNIEDYDKRSSIYRVLNDKLILNKLQRFQVGNDKALSYWIAFVTDFFKRNIPTGIMKNHERYLEYHIKSLINAVEKKTLVIPVVDKKVFSDFYKRVLQNCPQGTLYTTSIPTEGYFWEEGNVIETQMKIFVKNGGKIYRYFYIYN